MNRSTFIALVIFIFLPFTSIKAWSLKTHVFIAQQVLNDVLDDTAVQLAGIRYKVPLNIYYALKYFPDKFRMGSLGPDIFPDFIVGQITTHPGIPHGWKTDDWLKYILSNARTGGELAFCYGYIVHASSDIFAHTYVNMFAGDVFNITDTERTVELRHFMLEKFIEKFTPPILDNNGKLIDLKKNLSSPQRFLASTLILHDSVFKQHQLDSVSGPTSHLRSMYKVQNKVADLLRRIDRWTFDIHLFASNKNREKQTLLLSQSKLMAIMQYKKKNKAEGIETDLIYDELLRNIEKTSSLYGIDSIKVIEKSPIKEDKVIIQDAKEKVKDDKLKSADIKYKLEKETFQNQFQQLLIQERQLKTKIQNAQLQVTESKAFAFKLTWLKKLVTAWLNNINTSTRQYINASETAGLRMLNGEESPMDSYTKWMQCHAWAYAAVPPVIPATWCNVKNFIDTIKQDVIEKLSDRFPILAAILKKLKQYIRDELTPVFLNASEWMATNVFNQDAESVRLAYFMWKPADITLQKLDDTYKIDASGKKLLKYDNVSKYVLADMALNGTRYFNAKEFGPVANSITLSKLALLDPKGLNQLIKDNNGGKSESALYGSPVYPDYKGNYTILFNAVTSIDGNHQWQAYPLPYPRQDYSVKQEYSYSYDYNKDRSKGFRLWVDPELRSKVFVKLFNRSSLGSLAQELRSKGYPFPECPDNPFPSTIDKNGRRIYSDTTCIK